VAAFGDSGTLYNPISRPLLIAERAELLNAAADDQFAFGVREIKKGLLHRRNPEREVILRLETD
jgi:hypothetical protein